MQFGLYEGICRFKSHVFYTFSVSVLKFQLFLSCLQKLKKGGTYSHSSGSYAPGRIEMDGSESYLI
jgi:hypothetical protein